CSPPSPQQFKHLVGSRLKKTVLDSRYFATSSTAIGLLTTQIRFTRPCPAPSLDDSFNCFMNGRVELGYLRLWKLYECDIPRFNGRKMLELLRGKRLVFVGDSLNRNIWQVLVCSLPQLKPHQSFELS
ncbi:Protein trichome birefringence-like 4, partial [Linum perenne]